MPSGLLLVFNVFNIIFLLTGALFIGFAIKTTSIIAETPTLENVAERILLAEVNGTAIIANAAFIIFTFLLSIPALAMPTNRAWLRFHGWLIVFCALFSLVLGLTVWFDTLRTRTKLGVMWEAETDSVQSLLQRRFSCCGYADRTDAPPNFVQDEMCTNDVAAAQMGGCVGPFSNFANSYMDHIFTSAFGVVGFDVMMLLCTAMMLKRRQEQARFRYIDRKNGL